MKKLIKRIFFFGIGIFLIAPKTLMAGNQQAITLTVTVKNVLRVGAGSYSDINAALAGMLAGTNPVIRISPGIYQGNIILPDGASLEGASPDSVIIQGDGNGPVITIQGKSTISNITVTGGINGIELLAGSNAVIKNSIIRDNLGNAIIEVANAAATIENNTIFNNQTGISILDPANITIRNNIISKNLSNGVSNSNAAPLVVSYNNFWQNITDLSLNVADLNNIFTDPLFIDSLNSNFHLRLDSNAINSGDPASNFINEPTLNGGRINIGAYGNTIRAAVTDIFPAYFVSSTPGDGSIVNRLTELIINLADDGAEVDELNTAVLITRDGIPFIDFTRNNSLDNEVKLTFQEPLDLTEYLIAVTPIDLRGNSGGITYISIILDIAVPTLTLNSVSSPTNSSVQNISGTVDVGVPVFVSVNNAVYLEGTYPAPGSWQYSATLSEGANSIDVEAKDASGDIAVQTASIILDSVIPAFITDFSYSSATKESITFSWYAKGDDGEMGAARSYYIRYAEVSLDETNWSSANSVPINITPADSGNREEHILLVNLEGDKTYYFAIRADDDAGNLSEISNVLEVAIIESAAAPPENAPIADNIDDTVAASGCFIGAIRK